MTYASSRFIPGPGLHDPSDFLAASSLSFLREGMLLGRETVRFPDSRTTSGWSGSRSISTLHEYR